MTKLQKAREAKGAPNAAGPDGLPSDVGKADYEAVWQLEMWKRAEEAKFKAYLKQREIEKIEEITYTWKMKESDREAAFNDSLKTMEALDGKLRQKALDMQRREERIVQLEEELRHKITEVSRQLASKEEEVLNVKKRFKEEKNVLEHDRKKAMATIEDLKSKLEAADAKFYEYKQEVETSPLNVLRNELATK